MRIAILSLTPGHNYGGILQSYALQTILERMGHSVKVISKVRFLKILGFMMLAKYGVRIIKKYLLRKKDVSVRSEYNFNQSKILKLHNTYSFVDKYLHLRTIDSFDDVKDNEFDAFVVGSDQVWRPRYFEGQYQSVICNAFLAFAENWNVKRIAYAPSFGVDTNEYSETQLSECSNLLKKFDAVSVREQSGVELCKDYFGVSAIQLCDPTMLLTKADYLKLIDSNVPKSKGNLLVYCLDKSDELDKIVSFISESKGLSPFYTNEDSDGVKPPVESWIKAFDDAEFVVTDSFHACVFSLIFRKSFIVTGNKNRGMSRFESLLSDFGMKERLVTDYSQLSNDLIDLPLGDLDEKFERLREKALTFLKTINN